MFCIDITCHDTDGLICWNPVWEFQVFTEPFFFLPRKTLYLTPLICISQQGKKNDHNDIADQMPYIGRMPVVRYGISILFQYADQVVMDRNIIPTDPVFCPLIFFRLYLFYKFNLISK